MRRWLGLAVGILVSIVFLYIGLQGLDLSQVWDKIAHAQFLWIVPGVAIYFLAVWGRTWRWHYLLRPIKAIPLSRCSRSSSSATWATTSIRSAPAK